MSHRSNRTVALTTLGCKVNQAESDEWLRQFVTLGYEPVDFDAVADVYVVNTCSVTHVADRKSRQLLRHARRQNPAGLVVAAGCYASVATDEVARLAAVDLVVGGGDKHRLVSLVHDALEGESEQPLDVLPSGIRSFGPRQRGFVKIADGCDKFCAFCIIPYARGRVRSRPVDEVLRVVSTLTTAGHREIVLTAVHMGTYGRDLMPPTTLSNLIQRVLADSNIERLRLSSIEPEDFDESLPALWSDSRLCRHIHLALDSGSDQVLSRMRRRYSTQDFRSLASSLRSRIPGVALTTDIIVGFPGETESDFAQSLAFIAELECAAVHVFPYSSRRHTSASHFPDQVSPPIKQERTDRMLAAADQSAGRFRRRFIGSTLAVLFEQRVTSQSGETIWEGLSDNYLRVRVACPADLANWIGLVDVVREDEGTLFGQLREVPAATAVHPFRWELSSASR